MIRLTALHARYAGTPIPPSGAQGGDALRGLDLEVKPGRIYALLGPNGAGKTTLLRCLTGLLHPVSGSLQILGTEISTGLPIALRNRMGVLIESPTAYARMTAMEYLRFFAGFYLSDNPSTRIEELSSAFELESLSVRIGKLSQGNRRKVQLMRSLLHRPDLVLWDEPTEHLDPRAQRLALAHLRQYASSGATVLITSHRLEQMEEIADDYGFIKRGMLVHSLNREELNRTMDEAEIEGIGSLDTPVAAALKSRFNSTESIPSEKLRAGQWGLRLRGRNILAALPDVIDMLSQSGGKVVRVEPQGRSLESLYRHHVEEVQ